MATAAQMAQLLRTAAAIRDAHRETGNVRDARAVNRAMATLTALPLPATARQDPQDSPRSATSRFPAPVPGLALYLLLPLRKAPSYRSST